MWTFSVSQATPKQEVDVPVDILVDNLWQREQGKREKDANKKRVEGKRHEKREKGKRGKEKRGFL